MTRVRAMRGAPWCRFSAAPITIAPSSPLPGSWPSTLPTTAAFRSPAPRQCIRRDASTLKIPLIFHSGCPFLFFSLSFRFSTQRQEKCPAAADEAAVAGGAAAGDLGDSAVGAAVVAALPEVGDLLKELHDHAFYRRKTDGTREPA